MVDKAKAEKNYAKEWKKATYYVQEIKKKHEYGGKRRFAVGVQENFWGL